MADSVQRYLERSIPELKDLQKRKLFSEAEVKSIVKKRTDFEYAMRRTGIKKEDIMRYIEFEKSLEQLRVLRKKRLSISDPSVKKSTKSYVSDYSIRKRIIYIYDRAVCIFPADTDLWVGYIQYARSCDATGRLSKVFARAVQILPKCETLWAMAAAWEWEDNTSVVAARSLYQRGLRVNGDSKLLWTEYFRMELGFVVKLVERKRILGLNASALDDVEEPLVEEDENVKMQKQAESEIFRGAIAKAVYLNAVNAIPNDNQLHFSFLDIVKAIIDSKDAALSEDLRLSLTDLAEFIKSHIVGETEINVDVLQDLAEFEINHLQNWSSSEFPVKLKELIVKFQSLIEDLRQNGDENRMRTVMGQFHSFLFKTLQTAHEEKMEEVDDRIKMLLSSLLETLFLGVGGDECILNEKSLLSGLNFFKSYSNDGKLDEFLVKYANQLKKLPVSVSSVPVWMQIAHSKPKLLFEKLSLKQTGLSNDQVDILSQLWLELVNEIQSTFEDMINGALNFSKTNPQAKFSAKLRLACLRKQVQGKTVDQVRFLYPDCLNYVETISKETKDGSEVIDYILQLELEHYQSNPDKSSSLRLMRNILDRYVKAYPTIAESWIALMNFEKSVAQDAKEYQRAYNRLLFCPQLSEDDRNAIVAQLSIINNN